MAIEEEMAQRLTVAFAPAHLEIVNDSAAHAGHAGDDGTGQSHWRVAIRTEAFAGQSRIARHRAVHAALGPDIMGRIHALALDLDTP